MARAVGLPPFTLGALFLNFIASIALFLGFQSGVLDLQHVSCISADTNVLNFWSFFMLVSRHMHTCSTVQLSHMHAPSTHHLPLQSLAVSTFTGLVTTLCGGGLGAASVPLLGTWCVCLHSNSQLLTSKANFPAAGAFAYHGAAAYYIRTSSIVPCEDIAKDTAASMHGFLSLVSVIGFVTGHYVRLVSGNDSLRARVKRDEKKQQKKDKKKQKKIQGANVAVTDGGNGAADDDGAATGKAHSE